MKHDLEERREEGSQTKYQDVLFNMDKTDGKRRLHHQFYLQDDFIFRSTVKCVGACLHKISLKNSPISGSWSIHSQTSLNSLQKARDISLLTTVGLSQRIKYSNSSINPFMSSCIGPSLWVLFKPQIGGFLPAPMFWPWSCSELEVLELQQEEQFCLLLWHMARHGWGQAAEFGSGSNLILWIAYLFSQGRGNYSSKNPISCLVTEQPWSTVILV